MIGRFIKPHPVSKFIIKLVYKSYTTEVHGILYHFKAPI